MKLLLTGASGFIGRSIAESFRDRYELYTPSHIELDLTDSDAVAACLQRGTFDVVIHTANTNDFIHPDQAQYALDRNLRMFCNLRKCSDLYGKMLYFGSGAEYDKNHYVPMMSEEYFGTHIPTDPYGFSKYIMSELTAGSENIYDLRLFGVFGKYEEWRRRFISNMIYQALTGTEMHMDRNMYFDYLYIDDLCMIVEWFIHHKPTHHHFNVCTGQPVDLVSLAKIVKEETVTSAEIIMNGSDMKPSYTGDNIRLLDEMGAFTFTPVRDAVRKMVEFYRLHGFR